MSDLETQFQAAVTSSKTLTGRPSNEILLKLYSLYKQASVGDVQGSRPGMFKPVARAKYDAWKNRQGTPTEVAKHDYIALVKQLKNAE
ncbi:MAG: acyl-CoA-binding protein [Candidatus Promineifilaceae bacterium]